MRPYMCIGTIILICFFPGVARRGRRRSGTIVWGKGVCGKCNGKGVQVLRACANCNGVGAVSREKEFEVYIAPGR